MKLEFVKEEKINGDVFFYTTADGRFVEGSLELVESKAKDRFDFIVKANNIFPTKTVIAEATIDYNN
jgi:hypothetical protein